MLCAITLIKCFLTWSQLAAQTFTFCFCLVLIKLVFVFAEESGVSLLQLIGDPPPDDIDEVSGPDNSPGYVFRQSSNVGQSAAAHLPNPFYRDFSLIFNIKPTSTKPGVIFSITDSNQYFMYVGVKLSKVQNGKQDIIFYYTEPDSHTSYEAARFSVPSMQNTWTRFSISVLNEQVSLYFKCDSDPQVVNFERSPDDMDLDAGAGVFVGHAGGLDNDKFLVSSSIFILWEHDIFIKPKSS